MGAERVKQEDGLSKNALSPYLKRYKHDYSRDVPQRQPTYV